MDPEVELLASIAATLKADYIDETNAWQDSPFGWIKAGPSSRQIGKIGEQLVSGWLAAHGFNVARSPHSDADRLVEDHAVEIKMSTRWKGGTYKFQQVRDQSYDILICLGISPFDAHCWVLTKDEVLRHWKIEGDIHGQHTGATGADTAWIVVPDPDEPKTWIAGYGGTLRQGLERISGLTGFKPDALGTNR